MNRRAFIAATGGAVVLPPLAAWAQQGDMPVIGFLHSGAPEPNAERVKDFLKGLADAGFTKGRNVAIEYRWAMGGADKLPGMAADLVARKVALIATPASTPATFAAKAVTSTIPIVFGIGTDPVKLRLVASLSHPGGNITGVTSNNTELAAKRFELFRELVPAAEHYFALVNPTSQLTGPFTDDLSTGAAKAGVHVEILRASTDREIEAALATVAQQPGSVLLSASDSFFYIRRADIAALALKHAVPTMFDTHEYAEAGGLISYGSDFSDVMQLAGSYCGRILKGEKPGDLPIAQASRFELAINLKTAKALGLTVPPLLLAQADDLID